MAKENRKKKFLMFLKEGKGIISYACGKTGISRQTYYDWIQKDEQFKEACNEINENMTDWVESKLFSKINDEDLTAIIFYLKTKGRNRGYVEKSEFGLTNKEGNDVEMPRVTYVFGNSEFVDEFDGGNGGSQD